MKKSFGQVLLKGLICIAAVSLVMLASGCGPNKKAEFKLEDKISELVTYTEERMKKDQIAGTEFAIIVGDKVIYSNGFGFADVEKQRKMTADTPILLSSISKVITGITVMKLVEEGKISLDDDINKYLDFKVVNPNFKDEKITVRQLMAHTSSIEDGNYSDEFFAYGKDIDISLRDLLAGYLVPGGKYYDLSKNFSKNSKPGTNFSYSNVAEAMCGYIVERVTGVPYDQYSRQAILDPLGMKNASWKLKDTDMSLLAVPNLYENNALKASQQYSYADYPAGLLHASANELARLVLMALNKGKAGDTHIISEQTLEESFKNQLTSAMTSNEPDRKYQGLPWMQEKIVNENLIGHYGSDPGISNGMFFDREDGVGAIVLMNVDRNDVSDKFKDEMIHKLLTIAREYAGSKK